ncbi:MAG: hypothetical protein BWK76_04670 [Desulfobulbaceae bacterium A2]|nr:MAG: hypothetical protein BWK76_04670 [Desulfobulbaceae bacterium A2]
MVCRCLVRGRTLWLSTLLGIILLVLSRPCAGDELTAAERAWLGHHGNIVFVSQTEYPPFEFVENWRERSGMCIELVRWMESELGFRAEFRNMSFQEAQQAVLTGEADVLTSLFYSQERDRRFDFSDMTWEVPALIFVRAGRPDITRLHDLRGKRLAMQRGDYAAEFLQQQGVDFELVPTASFAEATNLVISGEADAVIGDQQIVLYHIYSRGLTEQLQSVGEPLYVGRNGMATADGRRELVAILNKGVALARERGVFDTITRKWLGTRYSVRLPWLQRYGIVLLSLAGLALVTAVLVIIWNARLRRAVAQRTAQLRESEEHYRRFIEALPVGVYQRTPGESNRLTVANPALVELFGYRDSADLMQSGSRTTYVRPEQSRRLNELLEEQGQVDGFEAELRSLHGQTIKVRIWARMIGAGEERRVEGVVIDMTEALRAEEERRRLAAAIEQAAEAVLITDARGGVLYVNPAFERITGYSRAEILGNNPRVLKSGEHDAAFYQRMWQALAEGQTWEGRIVNRRKDGSLYTEEACISPVRDEAGVVVNYVAVKRDVSREIALEQQLRQAQKMEAVGQLTGGVAHDFNNLLQVINGHADLALSNLAEGAGSRHHLEEIRRAGTRAARLVSQLLAFSRRQIMRLELVDPNAVIGELMHMLRRVISENIRLEFLPGTGVGSVQADRGMLEQVLLNLCVNARDAMPEGGELTLATEAAQLDAPSLAGEEEMLPGRYLLLKVSDNGCGMDQETLEHIFEPFFTTKPLGKGTGLGLATVYGIVRQHNGMIHAVSRPGQGTTFHLYLPVADQPLEAEETARPQASGIVGGDETVLLAEDDAMVRDLTRSVLEHAGYRVICAQDGEEALVLFRRHADEVNILLFDVVMPRMGGHEAGRRIQVQRPGLPLILASGYSEDGVHSDFVLDQGLTLLTKPFVIADLLRAVRGKLDSASSS